MDKPLLYMFTYLHVCLTIGSFCQIWQNWDVCTSLVTLAYFYKDIHDYIKFFQLKMSIHNYTSNWTGVDRSCIPCHWLCYLSSTAHCTTKFLSSSFLSPFFFPFQNAEYICIRRTGLSITLSPQINRIRIGLFFFVVNLWGQNTTKSDE